MAANPFEREDETLIDLETGAEAKTPGPNEGQDDDDAPLGDLGIGGYVAPTEEEEDDEGAPAQTAAKDTELEAAQNDEEREEIRARRRDEKRRKKEQARQRDASLRRERDQLANRVAQLEQQVAGVSTGQLASRIGQVDAELEKANNTVSHYKNLIATAAGRADGGATLAEATEQMYLWRRRLDELTAYKTNLVRQGQQRQPQGGETTQPADNPVIRNMAQTWASKHPWYKHDSPDQDSAIVRAIDFAMEKEDWDPTTPEYWTELDARIAKTLPHRTGRGKVLGNRNNRQSPVGGTSSQEGGTANRSGGKGTFKLSAERVSAMKEAGVWDDPKKRAAQTQAYMAYDRDHQS